jgi:predicted nucleic acid-binding protein
MITLIDSSALIEFLRPDGDPDIATAVTEVLDAGDAATCSLVELELWNGSRTPAEGRALAAFFATLLRLPITDEVWSRAMQIATAVRRRGVTVPASDIVIFSCAAVHKAQLLAHDKHFIMLNEHAQHGTP